MITQGANRHVVQDLTVAETATYYSKAFPMGFASYFGVWYKATAPSGTPDLKIELEHSYKLPATEGASDTNYVVPEGFSDIISTLGNQTAHMKSVSPIPAKYGRLKITGVGSNPTGSVLNVILFIQEA